MSSNLTAPTIFSQTPVSRKDPRIIQRGRAFTRAGNSVESARTGDR
jgi:hypothetical protein